MTQSGPQQSFIARNKRKLLLGGVGAVVVAVAAAVGIWYFFIRSEAPPEATLESAAAQLTEAPAVSTEAAPATDGATPTEAPSASAETAAPVTEAAAAGATGTWAVDTSIGEFSFADTTGTFAGFRVGEELSGIGQTEAVGRTPAVSGTIVIDGNTVTSGEIVADLSVLTTDVSRRDSAARGALDTDQFPTATFTLTGPLDLGEGAAAGEAVTVSATGDLTIHGVTTSVTFELQAQLVGDNIVVVGQVPVVFADYGVELPTAPVVLSLDDNGVIELQLFFSRA